MKERLLRWLRRDRKERPAASDPVAARVYTCEFSDPVETGSSHQEWHKQAGEEPCPKGKAEAIYYGLTADLPWRWKQHRSGETSLSLRLAGWLRTVAARLERRARRKAASETERESIRRGPQGSAA